MLLVRGFPIFNAIEPVDELLFKKYFCKLYQKLFVMDDSKHLPPRYSYAVKDLAIHFGVFERAPEKSVHSLSSTTSNISPHHLSLQKITISSPYESAHKKSRSGISYTKKISYHSFSDKDEAPLTADDYYLLTQTTSKRRDQNMRLMISKNIEVEKESSPYRSSSVPRSAMHNGTANIRGALKEIKGIRRIQARRTQSGFDRETLDKIKRDIVMRQKDIKDEGKKMEFVADIKLK